MKWLVVLICLMRFLKGLLSDFISLLRFPDLCEGLGNSLLHWGCLLWRF